MFTDIIMYLYDKEYLKLKSITDKIDYIKYKNISIYNTDFIHSVFNMPNEDIVKDIEYLDNILACDYFEYQNIMDNYNLKRRYGSSWLCDNGYMVNNVDELFIEWLDKYKSIYMLYDNYSNDLTSGKAYSNFIRMKTYIINTEYVIDTILKYIRSKDKDL